MADRSAGPSLTRVTRPVVRKRGSRAFTLIELLVVIAVLSLLISILIPSLNEARHMALRAACAANQHALGVAIHLYASANNGFMPPEASRWTVHVPTDTPVADCIASVLYPDYVPANAFFDPGFEYYNPYGSPYPEKCQKPYEYFPDSQGWWWVGYTWHGGYNVTYAWWWQEGHRAVSTRSYMPGVWPVPAEAEMCAPSRISPLVCTAWGDQISGVWAVSHYRRGDPADEAGTLPGINEWFLDGHVDWIPGQELVKGSNGGPNYYWWQSDPMGTP